MSKDLTRKICSAASLLSELVVVSTAICSDDRIKKALIDYGMFDHFELADPIDVTHFDVEVASVMLERSVNYEPSLAHGAVSIIAKMNDGHVVSESIVLYFVERAGGGSELRIATIDEYIDFDDYNRNYFFGNEGGLVSTSDDNREVNNLIEIVAQRITDSDMTHL